jgi:hypothetical protein
VEWSWRKQSREPLVLDVQEGLASLPKVQLPISEATREAAAGSNRTKRSINNAQAGGLGRFLFAVTGIEQRKSKPFFVVFRFHDDHGGGPFQLSLSLALD